MFRRSPLLSTLAVVLCGMSLMALIPIDLESLTTTWDLPEVKSRVNARAKGIGKVKLKGGFLGQIQLQSDGDFVATVDGVPFSATWSRKSDKSRRVQVDLADASVAALVNRYEDDIEAAAASKGVDLDTNLVFESDRSKVRVILRVKKKKGEIDARLKAKLRLVGTSSEAGGPLKKTTVKARLKGRTDTLDLFEIFGI